ncbi:hypothetical protein BJ944DRAFT_273237 [Cunninghamella echinulata]|nr:hypothetical protein BJ944DRAFT_273237 [Cunninghamella echinulata]
MWFYIQSSKTGHVISADRHIQSEGNEALRSQVYVYSAQQTDEELWRWDGQYIRNKATDLVLDIRKGRLRLIEDTEICLYHEKPLEQAQNQLWGMKDVSGIGKSGKLIYSISNEDWVLVHNDSNKLLLYPSEPSALQQDMNDSWDFINEEDFMLSTSNHQHNSWSMPNTPTLSSSADTYDYEYPPQALTPAKRGSQGSVSLHSMDNFKDFHDRLYNEDDSQLSDKGMSMAVAYHTWTNRLVTIKEVEDDESRRFQLQKDAENEALNILLNHSKDGHHKETILHLTNRYINQLYDEKIPL